MNIKKFIQPLSFALFCLFGFSTSHAELNLYNWKTYTSLSNVQTIATDYKGRIWVGTTGGVFIYDQSTEELTELRNTEGLLNLNISCIRSNDKTKDVFVCSSDGTIQIYDENGKWSYVTDIISAKYPDPIITDIEFVQDTAYISGGFGLTKFNTKERVFIETVIRFGSFTSGIRANDILLDKGNIWVATEDGIAKANLNSSMANPNSWEVFSKNYGLPENNVKYLFNFKDTLFIATDNYIGKFESATFTFIQNSEQSQEITGLSEKNNELVYSNKYDVYTIDNEKFDYSKYRDINCIFYDEISAKLFVGFKYFGISIFDGNSEKNILPNTPISNNFVNLDVDSQGRLWAATKAKGVNDGQGFMMLDNNDNKWYNFNERFNSKISNWAQKIKSVSNGDIFVGTWGGGLLKLTEKDSSFEITKYDTSNSPLTGAIPTSPDYAIAAEVLEDKKGDVWIINYGEGYAGPLLLKLDGNYEFESYYNEGSPSERQFLELAIDRYGTKWLGSNNFAKGLYYFNENNTSQDKSDDIHGKLNKSNSALLDNEITSIAIDKNGFIWLGTSSGLNFIYDSYPVFTNGKISVREESYLRNQYIHDIYVDAVNNKWIATNKGVWVLNEDASELLNTTILNSTNSPLIADEVLSITSDTKTGVMYFGTKFGLSTSQSVFVEPAQEYNISCYPQPFIPKKGNELYIDGLMQNSDVRILTVDGNLVRALTAKGRVAVWDGKDELGTTASSGVYIILGSSETAEGKGVGKFVLINR
ncbi:MAG: two-component regulator propeller domain-containing protein [bacterium]